MELLTDILEDIALGVGGIALLVILWGVIIGIIEFVRATLARRQSDGKQPITLGKVRYDIGYHLLLGLEFLIAADIIRSIVRPTLEELATLGALVVIRTVISYFLGRELKQFRDGGE